MIPVFTLKSQRNGRVPKTQSMSQQTKFLKDPNVVSLVKMDFD